MKYYAGIILSILMNFSHAQKLDNLEYATPKSISGGAIMSYIYNNNSVNKLFYDFNSLHFVAHNNLIKSKFQMEDDFISLLFWIDDDKISISGYEKAAKLHIKPDGTIEVVRELEYNNFEKQFKEDFEIKKKEYSQISMIDDMYLLVGKDKRYLIDGKDKYYIDFKKFKENKSKYSGVVWAINKVYVLEKYIVNHDNNFEGFVLFDRNTKELSYHSFPDSFFTHFLVDRKTEEFYLQVFKEDGSNKLMSISPTSMDAEIISNTFPHIVAGIFDGNIYYKEIFDEAQGHYLTDFTFNHTKSMLLDSVEVQSKE